MTSCAGHDPYSILGIEKTADLNTIKRAYRSKAKEHHPDQFSCYILRNQATKKMQNINWAYDCLKNSYKSMPEEFSNRSDNKTGQKEPNAAISQDMETETEQSSDLIKPIWGSIAIAIFCVILANWPSEMQPVGSILYLFGSVIYSMVLSGVLILVFTFFAIYLGAFYIEIRNKFRDDFSRKSNELSGQAHKSTFGWDLFIRLGLIFINILAFVGCYKYDLLTDFSIFTLSFFLSGLVGETLAMLKYFYTSFKVARQTDQNISSLSEEEL